MVFFLKEIEAVVQRCFVKKVFLEISQNSQENTCASLFLTKLQALLATLLKKRLWHRCFSVNFAKFLRTPFFIEHLWRLLREKNNVKVISCDFVNYWHYWLSKLLLNKFDVATNSIVISHFLDAARYFSLTKAHSMCPWLLTILP